MIKGKGNHQISPESSYTKAFFVGRNEKLRVNFVNKIFFCVDFSKAHGDKNVLK